MIFTFNKCSVRVVSSIYKMVYFLILFSVIFKHTQEVFLYVVRGWSVDDIIISDYICICSDKLLLSSWPHCCIFIPNQCLVHVRRRDVLLCFNQQWIFRPKFLTSATSTKIAKSYFCPVFVAFSQGNNWRSWWVLGLNRCDVCEHIQLTFQQSNNVEYVEYCQMLKNEE